MGDEIVDNSKPLMGAAADGALRVRDACDFAGLGRSKIFELIAEGRIRSVKVDGRRLILKRSLVELLAEGLDR